MIKSLLQSVRYIRQYFDLPALAKAEHARDRTGLPACDHGPEEAVREGIGWLCRAQDYSASKDGGIARHYSLISGWGVSYPETTGYIIPTFLAYAKYSRDERVRQRAKRMLDWLVTIQLPCGGFQGGVINAEPIIPVTFNTGQVLLGLAAGCVEFGEIYRTAMCKAADWLVDTQDSDGCWRKAPTPFASPGEKTYETHVAWGLLEAARVHPKARYAEAALANVNWALHFQQDNGWFDKCCLSNPITPLTHTIGYAFRGMTEAYLFTKDRRLLQAALKTADGLLTAVKGNGLIPGRLFSDWKGAGLWACLTGSAQIAHCWLILFEQTGDTRYRDAGYSVNRYIRCTQKMSGEADTRGGIKGSFPVNGGYCSYEYPNWACKFFVDSNMLELKLKGLER